jgi:hypothetical protein
LTIDNATNYHLFFLFLHNICSLMRDWSIVWMLWINFSYFTQRDLKMVYQCEKNIKFSWKKAQKVDFENFLDPFWGFELKTVPEIHDPRTSWLPFGTKNHEMWGPPISTFILLIESWSRYYFLHQSRTTASGQLAWSQNDKLAQN